MLGRSTVSASSAASFLFPNLVQRYWDAVLEQAVEHSMSTLKLAATLPDPLIALLMVAIDLLIVAGFVAFTLASVKSIASLLAVAAVLRARKAP